MSHVVPIPVGDRPGWELDDQSMNIDRAPWHSVADSLVIRQSLKQSREKWLSAAFPRLPKPRGSKQAGQNIPFHEYKAHDKFELVVGPHIFSDTALFEAIYTYTSDQRVPTQPSGSVEMYNMVNAAAQSNPQLKQLIEQLHVQPGSDEHYNKLVEMLRSVFPDRIPGSSAPQVAAPQALAWDLVIEFREKPFDRWIFPRGSIQLESKYNTTRGARFDVMVNTVLPYSQAQIGVDLHASGQQETLATSNIDDALAQPVTFHWRGVTQRMYDLLISWSSTSQPRDAKTQDQLPSRVYLPYQLPDGEVLDMMRAALVPPYTMKSIRPANADSGRTKRRNTRRKSAAEKALIPARPTDSTGHPPSVVGGQFSTFSIVQAIPQPISPVAPPPFTPTVSRPSTPMAVLHTQMVSQVPVSTRPQPAPSLPQNAVHVVAQSPIPITSQVPVPSVNVQHSASSSAVSVPIPMEEGPPKHKRYSQPPPTCKSCHQANVQLMHGGWYCRACIEAKKFLRPEVVVRSRPSSAFASPSSTAAEGSHYRQSAQHARSPLGAQPPIVPGTQFSHWTPPSK